MGNKDSRPKFHEGYIFVETPRAANIGQKCGGIVHLNLEMRYPGKYIELEIQGVQKVKWHSH